MRVIFLEDVPGTADAGEVKVVKNGFARNFLLPRGLAAPATTDALQRANAIEKAAQVTRVKHSGDWQVVADAISGAEVVVEARVGPSGRLFGAITGRHIAERLSELTGRTLDHRQVLLGEAIHDPGDYNVNIRLYREVTATVKVSVVPEGYPDGLPESMAGSQASAEVSDEAASEAGEAVVSEAGGSVAVAEADASETSDEDSEPSDDETKSE